MSQARSETVANVEIVSGLNESQPVILLGKRALADGQVVQVESK